MSDEQPAIIMASTVSTKTMADDTLRLTIDIDPRYANEAFALYGRRGTPVALARITQEAALAQTRQETIDSDGHGRHYNALHRMGWFFNPRVAAVFDVLHLPTTARTEPIKAVIYGDFGVSSMAAIPPEVFRDYCAEKRIEDTLPKEFGQ
jgi:hypothetical protein